jgi:hypothetical protein
MKETFWAEFNALLQEEWELFYKKQYNLHLNEGFVERSSRLSRCSEMIHPYDVRDYLNDDE